LEPENRQVDVWTAERLALDELDSYLLFAPSTRRAIDALKAMRAEVKKPTKGSDVVNWAADFCGGTAPMKTKPVAAIGFDKDYMSLIKAVVDASSRTEAIVYTECDMKLVKGSKKKKVEVDEKCAQNPLLKALGYARAASRQLPPVIDDAVEFGARRTIPPLKTTSKKKQRQKAKTSVKHLLVGYLMTNQVAHSRVDSIVGKACEFKAGGVAAPKRPLVRREHVERLDQNADFALNLAAIARSCGGLELADQILTESIVPAEARDVIKTIEKIVSKKSGKVIDVFTPVALKVVNNHIMQATTIEVGNDIVSLEGDLKGFAADINTLRTYYESKKDHVDPWRKVTPPLAGQDDER